MYEGKGNGEQLLWSGGGTTGLAWLAHIPFQAAAGRRGVGQEYGIKSRKA